MMPEDGISGPGSIFFFSYVDDRIQREAAKLGDANTVQKKLGGKLEGIRASFSVGNNFHV